mmetsp:Transcript_8795/g.17160  ORF Transcript_8795/g.17160 Transcript_8795/m.17160 type:complete len:146 (+) Transcript_8795:98-535(+)
MPLRRSQSSRNLSLACIISTRKRSAIKEPHPVHNQSTEPCLSTREDIVNEILETKARFSTTLRIKRLRTSNNNVSSHSTSSRGSGSGSTSEEEDEDESKAKFYCNGCKERTLKRGIFMYLDEIFCSESCREAAIALDEMQFLRVS